MNNWPIYQGTGEPHDGIERLPPPPPWRTFDGEPLNHAPPTADDAAARRLGDVTRATTYRGDTDEIQVINSALVLRRPLLVTGRPGTGKSTLAYAIAHELRLGTVLRWPITSRSTLLDGLYQYDAIRRVEDASLADEPTRNIGRYLRLGPLGTAMLPYRRPRVLLIDELDKGDIDLPNDLLNLFEEGEFEIPELARLTHHSPPAEVQTSDRAWVGVPGGLVQCHAFPIIVITSNGEREFPPAFLRRCMRLALAPPSPERLARIVNAHLGPEAAAASSAIIEQFLNQAQHGELATDQLLNAIYVNLYAGRVDRADPNRLASLILQHLTTS